jgi:cytoskeleton protein RodZ
MNAVVDEAGKNVTEFRVPGPGERLRSARLARGLELSKLAAQLHLSDATVQALERDDFAALPGRVFVRGYIRNYARLVGIPVDSVLKQLDEQMPDDAQTLRLNPVGAQIRREVRSSHGVVRLITWLVALAVAGLFVVWWKGYLSWQTADDAAAAVTTAPVAAVSQPTAPTLPGDRAASPPPRVESKVSPAATTAPAVTFAAGPPDSAPPPARPTPARSEPGPSASAAASSAPPVAAEPAEPVVQLSFDGACWVDVRDAERKFKLFGEMPKGTTKVLGGKPPYDVVLGNAGAVRVSVNGEPYDVGRHALGNVARFRLDPRQN